MATITWYAEEKSNVCPTGWHVPTIAAWTILTVPYNNDMVMRYGMIWPNQ